MSSFTKGKKNTVSQSRRKRREEDTKTKTTLFEKQQVLGITKFLTFALLIILICFVGQTPAGTQVLPNQISNIRIVANFPFIYESKTLTQRKEEELRKRIAPVYQLNLKPYNRFEKDVNLLLEKLETLQKKPKEATLGKENARIAIRDLKLNFGNQTGLFLNTEDLEYLLSSTTDLERRALFNEGLIILREIFREGVYNPDETGLTANKNLSYFFSIEIDGRNNDSRVLSEEEALRFLRINLAALDISSGLSRTLFRILKSGIQPNLVYDPGKSEQKVLAAIEKMSPVIVEVEEGQTIIEPGTLVGPEQYEQVLTYSNQARENDHLGFGFNASILDLVVSTLGILFAALLYLRISLPELLKSNQQFIFCATVCLLNLLIIRLIFELGDSKMLGSNTHFLAILPYLAPVTLSAILISIMLNSRMALIVSLLVSCFYALMLGNLVRFFLTALLPSLIAIYACRNVKMRAKVIRASALGGLAVAICAGFVGLFNDISLRAILNQMLTSQITGVVTGVMVLTIMPPLQNAFNLISDITLLELTDFNHPILRKLQLEAPGTYHHSLMVANLAERAAAEINANPLFCRVGALFHDIGKLVKPEYFVENQKEGLNPHMERNPSMSALVIKSHVKEGLSMGKEAHLPQVVLDIIQQHHGTTLIKYFYDKALRQKHQTELPFELPEDVIQPADSSIDESTFRYDGPRPRFTESALVLLADSVEAASRALKKVSAQSIDELIDMVFREKLEDHQFDECSLTFKEIKKIKQSFAFTLLNMLHARIEYPKKEKPKAPLAHLPKMKSETLQVWEQQQKHEKKADNIDL